MSAFKQNGHGLSQKQMPASREDGSQHQKEMTLNKTPTSFHRNRCQHPKKTNTSIQRKTDASIQRRWMPASKGNALNDQKKSLQPFNHSYTVSNKPTSIIDITSQSHLRQCNLSHLGEPYEVTGNGSCLFNAVSFALCGSEDLSTELKYRTCIEMVSRKDFYTSLPIAKNIIWVSPNYITSTFECASKHGWSSTWTLLALAQVICIPIKSVYPPLNGENDLSFKTLNSNPSQLHR
ncbi:unnamed protein product [Mytilus coruscus]|uniref:OTU domain-containing protein n=1 Tax=Mytilus coruscus TaxID=42192 RepID=A0A6J7ZYI9_MYTCO|nr:unnamed protein product [Mytilus coruscus]